MESRAVGGLGFEDAESQAPEAYLCGQNISPNKQKASLDRRLLHLSKAILST